MIRYQNQQIAPVDSRVNCWLETVAFYIWRGRVLMYNAVTHTRSGHRTPADSTRGE